MSPPRTPASTSAERRVVLLRGINFGKGARIAMADLRACTTDAGCAEVATVLATGNIVVTDPRGGSERRAALEPAYAKRFGYNALVLVIDRNQLDMAAAEYPFESLDEHHDYLVFSDDPDVSSKIITRMHDAIEPGGTESVAPGPGCVYWRVPRGSTLSSAAGKVLDQREYRSRLTTRNLNTVRRIFAVG